MKKKIYVDIAYGRDKKIKGYILDISKTGAAIASPAGIKKGALLKISFKSLGLMLIKCKVVRVNKTVRKGYNYKIGIKFISLDSIQKNILYGFISGLDKRKFFRLEFI